MEKLVYLWLFFNLISKIKKRFQNIDIPINYSIIYYDDLSNHN
jgi:hypothetical protein